MVRQPPVASPLFTLLLAIGVALGFASRSAAQGLGSITGRVLDGVRRAPVPAAIVSLNETNFTTTTNSEGSFRLVDVPAGTYRLRVVHVGYGDHSATLAVTTGAPVELTVVVTERAIALEPLTVEVRGEESRSAGTQQNVVTREDIQQALGKNQTLADLLRTKVPGVRVRRQEGAAGTPICIEFRGATRGGGGRCRSPAVFMDGVPLSNPTAIYESLTLETIERIEIVPVSEAGLRFGTGSGWGALLISTRPAGKPETRALPPRIEPDAVRDSTPVARPPFDWAHESATHASRRVFVTALVGNAAGLAIGALAADQCVRLDKKLETDCGTGGTIASISSALLLPAVGGAIASRFAGRTEQSQGKLIPAVIGTSAVLVPGYALMMSSSRSESDLMRAIGAALLVLGAPLATTAADRLYRRWRH